MGPYEVTVGVRQRDHDFNKLECSEWNLQRQCGSTNVPGVMWRTTILSNDDAHLLPRLRGRILMAMTMTMTNNEEDDEIVAAEAASTAAALFQAEPQKNNHTIIMTDYESMKNHQVLVPLTNLNGFDGPCSPNNQFVGKIVCICI
jgi:hypothetical protein